MTSHIKVSILMPVYNVAPYLKQCLDSLCNQTLQEIEIICVDDGSTDGSLEILYRYQQQDSRIKILENKIQGAGAALARNMGLDHAQGDYLLILDSDDYFSLELAEKTYQRGLETGAEIVLFDAHYFDNDTGAFIKVNPNIQTSILPNQETFSPKDTEDYMLIDFRTMAWTQLYQRSFIEKHQLRFQAVHGSDDIFFVFAAMASAKVVSALSEKLVYYRRNNRESQVGTLDYDPLTPIKVSHHLKEWLEEKELFEELFTSYIKKITGCCNFFLRHLKNYENFKLLYDTLRFGGIEDLGFVSVKYQSKRPEFVTTWANNLLNTTSAEEYLYEEHKNFHQHAISDTGFMQDIFSTRITSFEEKVILYGAGVVGKAYFAQNILCQFCNIVAWVDKNHENLDFPISGLECLSSLNYDTVLIAVRNQAVALGIQQDLIQAGIPEEKIKWEKGSL